jgi:antirestriction protein ArdC
MAKISTEDIYAEVNARVLDALSKGTAPWQKPWSGGSAGAPRNLQSGKPYRGINALLTALSGYSDPRWTTAPAAFKLEGRIRKGEKSTLLTLWKRIVVKDADAPDGQKVILMLRYFRVFNVEQIDWPEGAIKPLPTPEPAGEWDGHIEAERVLQSFLALDNAPGLSTRDSDAACYIPSLHEMRMPASERFYTAEGFYGTAFHECGHATGHKSMLDRADAFGNGFGSDRYAREELVAEMCAAFVCAIVGVDGGFDNSVAYLKNWQSRIANDPKLIVQAAGRAQKAADLILGTEFTEDPAPVAEKEAVTC